MGHPDMTVEEAIPIIGDAIKAIDNDMGSGSNIDICIVKFDGEKYGNDSKNIIGQSSLAKRKFRPIVSEYRRHYFYVDPIINKKQRMQNIAAQEEEGEKRASFWLEREKTFKDLERKHIERDKKAKEVGHDAAEVPSVNGNVSSLLNAIDSSPLVGGESLEGLRDRSQLDVRKKNGENNLFNPDSYLNPSREDKYLDPNIENDNETENMDDYEKTSWYLKSTTSRRPLQTVWEKQWRHSSAHRNK